MTIEQWLNQAKRDKEKLQMLIAEYHPVQTLPRLPKHLPITAAGAEMACANVREAIHEEQKNIELPVVRFHKALESNDWKTVDRLLNDAWFGVPESTSCWSIQGFSEAVALMEDPPEIDDTNSHD